MLSGADQPRELADGTAEDEDRGVVRALGLGVITGACDDDRSAIGIYASAGAQFGPAFLWTAPITLPMMYAVVYLSSKLGQVSGRGLFHVIKDNYARWILWPALVGVLIGNTIEAAADLGGMAAAINLFLPVLIPLIVVAEALIILALQISPGLNVSSRLNIPTRER
jgi:Mn2+/Fe2+ NRAMP family transporter